MHQMILKAALRSFQRSLFKNWEMVEVMLLYKAAPRTHREKRSKIYSNEEKRRRNTDSAIK